MHVVAGVQRQLPHQGEGPEPIGRPRADIFAVAVADVDAHREGCADLAVPELPGFRADAAGERQIGQQGLHGGGGGSTHWFSITVGSAGSTSEVTRWLIAATSAALCLRWLGPARPAADHFSGQIGAA